MIEIAEIITLLGEKELRIYELQRDLNAAQKQLESITKNSAPKPAPALPFPTKDVNPVEHEQVD